MYTTFFIIPLKDLIYLHNFLQFIDYITSYNGVGVDGSVSNKLS